jgi:hypothetical protein
MTAGRITWAERVALVKLTNQSFGLAAIVKRTYALPAEPGGKVALADAQLGLTELPRFDYLPGSEDLLDDVDLLPPKVATDVVVSGHAHARAPTRELLIAVAVGNITRRLRVVGPRRVDVSASGVARFSSADHFEKVKLSDGNAYGGYDEFAQDQLEPLTDAQIRELGMKPPGPYGYARNERGKGYFIDTDRQRAKGADLPLIEDPSDLLTPERFFVPRARAWIDQPITGRLGWVHHARYPRLGRIVGTLLEYDPPTHPVRETLFADGEGLDPPRLVEDGKVHPRVLQGASPGLAIERLRGDELCILQNLHRKHAELRFNLPAEAPRATLRLPELKALTPSAILNTVRIEPDDDRVSLTWCCMVPTLGGLTAKFVESATLDVSWDRLG